MQREYGVTFDRGTITATAVFNEGLAQLEGRPQGPHVDRRFRKTATY
jgi:hypothetical protein